MKTSNVKFVFLAAFASVALSAVAAPKIVYVVPGGSGDGTSWATAYGAVADAYASAAAFADGGFDSGEVWIKTGRYLVNEVPMRSGVTVRGGFAGTETSADEADPKAYPTVLTGDLEGSGEWYPNGAAPTDGVKRPIWSGEDKLTFNHPDPDNEFTYSQMHLSAKWYLFRANGDPLENCGFVGLTLSDTYRYSISFEGTTNKNLYRNVLIRDCTFVANGSLWSNYGDSCAILAQNVSGVITNCSFYGNHAAICSQVTSDFTDRVVTDLTVADCLFEKCGRSCCYFGTKTNLDKVTVRRCTFKDNCANGTHANHVAACMTSKADNNYSVPVLFSDCLVTNCVMINKAQSAFIIGGIDYASYGTNSFTRCRFVDNRLISDVEREKSAATCVVNAGRNQNTYFTDCAFVRNSCTFARKSTASICGGWSTVVSTGANDTGYFYNCTFDGNQASATTETSYAGTFGSGNSNTHIVLVNSVSCSNRMEAVSSGYAADCMVGLTGFDNFTRFVNSILWSDASDYTPFQIFWNGSGVKPYLVAINSSLKNFDKEAISDRLQFPRYYGVDVSGADPKFSPLKSRNGTLALGLTSASPATLRKGGLPVYWHPNGRDGAVYDPAYSASKPWYVVGVRTEMTAEAAEAIGLTTESALLADAFGAARVPGKIAYGPLNYTSGLAIVIR